MFIICTVPRTYTSKLPAIILKTLFAFQLLVLIVALSIKPYIKPKNSEVLGTEGLTYYVSLQGNDVPGCGLADGVLACKSLNYILANVTTAELGGTVLVGPGVYTSDEMIKINKRYESHLTIRSKIPYKAFLVGKERTIDFRNTKNVSIEDFEISHHSMAKCINTSDPQFERKRYVIQISDGDSYNGPTDWYYDSNLRYIPRTDDYTYNITIKNNIIHDSYCDDLLKINKVGNIKVIGNVFFNQGGPVIDEHIDANSVFNVDIDENIFFNDYSGSNRELINSGPFIVIKDSSNGVPLLNVQGLNASNGNIFFDHPGTLSSTISNTNPRSACNPAGPNCDSISGNNNVKVRKNIFMNWQSNYTESPLIDIGNEDSEIYVAINTLIENNLFLGNNTRTTRALLGAKASYNTIFRHNTVIGDLPAKAFALRARTNNNQNYTVFPNKKLTIYNNIWADYSGTMGKQSPTDPEPEFAEASTSTINSSLIHNNIYWNNSLPIPDRNQALDYSKDLSAITLDPNFANTNTNGIPLYRWNGSNFGGSINTIREVFEKLVTDYASINPNSPAVNKAVDVQSTNMQDVTVDILGRERGNNKDIGAFERNVQYTGPQTQVVKAIEDTYIHEQQPTQNFGNADSMVASSAPNRTTFIKFDLRQIPEDMVITEATLVYKIASGVYAGSVGTHKLQTVHSSTWNESTLNYNNRPTLSGGYFGAVSNVQPGYEVNLNLINQVNEFRGKFLSIVIDSTSEDNFTFMSSESASPPEITIKMQPKSTSTNKFVGTYFDNLDLTNPKFENEKATIDYNWKNQSPHSSIGVNSFSARWVGTFDFDAREYTFTTHSDDGVRLYIDGVLVIDDWRAHALEENSHTELMQAGTHEIKLEYFENIGNAQIKLEW